MGDRNGRGRNRTQRLFGTTKGSILTLLCQGKRTVNELASALQLTDNAVRAQLLRLHRDGLVHQAGSRRGVRKPHVDYEITQRGRRLFPTAYEQMLQAMLSALAEDLPPRVVRALLGDVLRRLAQQHAGPIQARTPRQRLREFVAQIEERAPGFEVQDESSGTLLRACSCPLASVTASHPELCQLVGDALGELLRTKVREQCLRGEWPQCRFAITQ